MTKAYYNEFDPYAAAWLRQLITAGHIAPGDVDERSISDVQPDDLKGYTQCHFFAGIGGWSYALRLAGWPDDQPVWTGSCPCQPFSVAGKHKGVDDERHLWPQFARLIGACQPSVIFGEQVASKDGRTWLATVFADLENMAYRRAGADLCAAGVGAPHIRQRLWWVADAQRERRQLQPLRGPAESECVVPESEQLGEQSGTLGAGVNGMAKSRRTYGIGGSDSEGLAYNTPFEWPKGTAGVESCGTIGVALGDAKQPRSQGHGQSKPVDDAAGWQTAQRHSATPSVWSNVDWLSCLDHKTRPIESGLSPLVDVLPRGVVPNGDPSDQSYANATAEARVMRLRGYGNAIVPQLAATFIEAYVEALND